MLPDYVEMLKQHIAAKEQEIKALRVAISEIYRERRKTCTHPNMESSMSEHSCPHCGYHKDRSF